METMIERVEKAIADQLGLDLATLYKNKSEWIDDRGARHDINTPYRGDITDAACAAIEAMREPTEAMALRGLQEMPFGSGSPSVTKAAYRAMIDAALTATKAEQPPA